MGMLHIRMSGMTPPRRNLRHRILQNTSLTFATSNSYGTGDGWSPQGGIAVNWKYPVPNTPPNAYALIFVPDNLSSANTASNPISLAWDESTDTGNLGLGYTAYADNTPGGYMGSIGMTGTSLVYLWPCRHDGGCSAVGGLLRYSSARAIDNRFECRGLGGGTRFSSSSSVKTIGMRFLFPSRRTQRNAATLIRLLFSVFRRRREGWMIVAVVKRSYHETTHERNWFSTAKV